MDRNMTRMCIIGLVGMFLGITTMSRAQSESPSVDPRSTSLEATPATTAHAFLKQQQFARVRGMIQGNKMLPVIVQLDVPNIQGFTRDSVRAKGLAAIKTADQKLAQAIDQHSLAEVAKLRGTPHRVNRVFNIIPFVALDVSSAALNALERSPGVLGISNDALARPMLNNTVGIIGANVAWGRDLDGTGWYVAIHDTGVLATHEFFAGKDIIQACFARGENGTGDCPNGGALDTTSPNPAQPYPSNFSGYDHGTHVAGISVGNGPSNPSAGVARGADLIAVQVFSKFEQSTSCDPQGQTPSNCLLSFGSDQIAAMEFVFSLRDTINIASVNMSLGGGEFSSQASCDNANAAVKTMIDTLRTIGTATVIAAGNDGFCDALSGPGCISSAVAVGAVTDGDSEAGFSNFHSTMLDIYAPGVAVLSSVASSNTSYGNKSGTSMATPHVAGTWAIMRQALPNESVDFILNALQDTGASVAGGCGVTPTQKRIQIDAALDKFAPSIRSCLLSELVAADVIQDAELGSSIAMDNGVAAIAARSEDCLPDLRCGAVYMRRWNGSEWVADGKLVSDVPTSFDRFGSAIDLHQDRVVVGVPFHDVGLDVDAGMCHIFSYDGVNWVSEQLLTALAPGEIDRFGTSVALGTNVLLVGVPNENNSGSNDGTGAVNVFNHDGTSWNQTQIITASDPTSASDFGIALAMSGNVAIVGSPSTSCLAGLECGTVYVFEFDGSSWVEQQKLEPFDRAAGDNFGFSVTMDQGVIVVGAPFVACASGGLCGAIYVFEQAGSTWNQVAKIQAFDAGSLDFFGWSIAIAGDIGMVGAWSNDCLSGSNCGTAYVMRRDSMTGWFLDAKLTESSLQANDQYGWSVALDDSQAMVGARLRDTGGLNNSGSAFSYGITPDCNGNRIADVCDIVSGFSVDDDLDGEPDECICPFSSIPVTDTLGSRNRFLAFSAGDPTDLQAIRVLLTELPVPFDVFDGLSLWVGQPREISENSGIIDPVDAPEWPTFWAATLQCDPFVRDWSGFDLLNIYHRLIVPGGRYTIQVVGEVCNLNDPSSYSDPLILMTSGWGDVVDNCSVLPCGPPDGVVNVTTDVTAVLEKFKNAESGPRKSRSDIEPALIDFKINFTDVTFALDGFKSLPYPFLPPLSSPCP